MAREMRRFFLSPGRKLVDEVADWLCGLSGYRSHIRIVAGARSLSHVMVIVPTEQSGRQLRLKLAQRAEANGWGGILSPRVVKPLQIVCAADESFATASRLQLRAMFLKFIENRPRRETVRGEVVLREWSELFHAAYIADFGSHLSFLDQLNDIWRVLAGDGLLMRDVLSSEKAREVLAAAQGNEVARWEELSELETAFFDFLHARGLRHEAEAIHLAKTAAQPIPDEIEEVVLPGLVDPVAVVYDVLRQQREELEISVLVQSAASEADRFDEWGRPKTQAWIGSASPVLKDLRTVDIVRAATDAELSGRIAADFPPADSHSVIPSLALCDETLYPGLSAAFLNIGYELHNPARHMLAASSLGRIISNLVTLYLSRAGELPWETFVALVREADVLGAVLSAIPKDANGLCPGRRAVLEGLDICRNTFLPRTLPRDCAFDETRLRSFDRASYAAFRQAAEALLRLLREAWDEADGGASVAEFVRGVLRRLYAARRLGTSEGDREFRAATQTVRDILGAFDGCIAALDLPEGASIGLFRKAIAEASYSLEPDSRTALRTEGWLELAWSEADKIALAGFSEGAVPDAVMGHAFLPEALRTALGLTSNEQRLARDTYLLKALLSSRADSPGAVRAYVAQTNDAGDVRRPSRLLFLVAPDELAARTKHLFCELRPRESLPGRCIAEGWLPNLPNDVAPHGKSAKFPDGRLSASAIDEWLKCPFTYLFQYGLDMRRVEEKNELEANDFGSLIHKVLEMYASEQLARTADGLEQLNEVADIQEAFVRILTKLRAAFGAHPRLNLRLQMDAALGRLMCFARIQAKWSQEGWRIAERPEYDFVTRPFEGEEGCDVTIKGSVDRIDFKEGVGYRIIDYKTWDRREGAWRKIVRKGLAESQHAARLHLPLAAAVEEKDRERLVSIQPFLYGRCLEKVDPRRFEGRIADFCYAILGRTSEDAVVMGSIEDQGEFEAVRRGKVALVEYKNLALETARTAIRRIRAQIFWPPGPTKEWRRDVSEILAFSPERDFRPGTAWREAQEAKLVALEGGVRT